VTADDPRTDEQLLRAARVEREAFVAFYRRHAERTKRWLERHASRDPETVQDLLAETFAEALVSLPRFRARGEGSGAAWLHGIARNQQRHLHRRRRVAERARRSLGVPVREAPDEWSDHEERLLSEQLRPLLQAALTGLPADQRDAVVLRVVREQEYAEVARSLGCSEQAARARVSRGLRTLKAGLAPALTPKDAR
jgi:RNA polymerase sigma-70 factor (ECF subfamily)